MKPTSIAVTNDMQSITSLAIDPVKAFREAFLKARVQFKSIIKTAPGHFNKYADYNDVYSAIEQALQNNGFFILQPMKLTPTGVALTTRLCHVEGHEEISEILLPLSEELFDIGKSITYLRRYQLVTLLGLPTQDEAPLEDGGDPEKKTSNKSSPNTPLINPNSKEFRYKFGKYSGKSFGEVEAVEPGGNQSYIAWLMSKDREKNKPIQQAFWAWEKFHAASKGHKDFEEPPPHEDMDIQF